MICPETGISNGTMDADEVPKGSIRTDENSQTDPSTDQKDVERRTPNSSSSNAPVDSTEAATTSRPTQPSTRRYFLRSSVRTLFTKMHLDHLLDLSQSGMVHQPDLQLGDVHHLETLVTVSNEADKPGISINPSTLYDEYGPFDIAYSAENLFTNTSRPTIIARRGIWIVKKKMPVVSRWVKRFPRCRKNLLPWKNCTRR